MKNVDQPSDPGARCMETIVGGCSGDVASKTPPKEIAKRANFKQCHKRNSTILEFGAWAARMAVADHGESNKTLFCGEILGIIVLNT